MKRDNINKYTNADKKLSRNTLFVKVMYVKIKNKRI